MPGNFPNTVKFEVFKTRHPEYDADYWKRCRVLYKGGSALLEDKETLKKIMPQHSKEDYSVYEERLARAFYIPYCGSIIDKLTSELTGKPLTLGVDEDGDDKAEAQVDDFYADFFADCSRPDGSKQSLNQLAREQVLTALQTGRAWTLVDLPPAPEEGYANKAQQDAAGALEAYACAIEPEAVIDWEQDEAGAMKWAIVMETINQRQGLVGDRDQVTLRFRYFLPDSWAVYEITYSLKKEPHGPKDTADVKLVSSGSHSFGQVPLIPLELPAGLWAMSKLEAIARAHMNQRNALSWGQLKALFPVPVLYAAAANPMDPVSEDENRALQPHGPGYMVVLSGGSKDHPGDKLEYFSPDSAPYKVAADDLNVLRDEMHRVLHAMAQSVDNSGAALQRSAESKSVDAQAGAAILRALGVIVREHFTECLESVARGRKDGEPDFVLKGMDIFDDVSLTDLVNDAVLIESVGIPSATFQKRFKLKIAKLALGAEATDEELAKIEEELEQTLTQDTFDLATEAEQAGHETAKAGAEEAWKQAKAPIPKPGTSKPKAKKTKPKSKKKKA